MDIKDILTHCDGLTQAKLIKEKSISSKELCTAAIEKIEEINPKINAVITKTYDRALSEASLKKEGIFAGVPFLVKDLLCYEKGVPYTLGSKCMKNYIAEDTTELLKRFKDTGLIILGRTNVPEFGLLATTEPEAFGPTLNPFGLEYSPGGSSGGSAASIAAGFAPIASGNDGGGSIRIPASNCNLFGLKPTRGRNPTGPHMGELWCGAAVEHILSKSVEDSAAMLDATSYRDNGAPYIIESIGKPYAECCNKPLKDLKVAFTTKTILNTPVADANKMAVMKMVKILEDLGFIVEESFPLLNGYEVAKSFFTILLAEISLDLFSLSRLLNRKIKKDDVEQLTWFLAHVGKYVSAQELLIAKKIWEKTGRIFSNFHERYDLILTPTLAYPPPKLGLLMPHGTDTFIMEVLSFFKLTKFVKNSNYLLKNFINTLSYTPFTFLANITGAPAMNIPTIFDEQGLPIGVQFIAPFGREDILFNIAFQLEKIINWQNLGIKHLKV
jgi:amidase